MATGGGGALEESDQKVQTCRCQISESWRCDGQQGDHGKFDGQQGDHGKCDGEQGDHGKCDGQQGDHGKCDGQQGDHGKCYCGVYLKVAEKVNLKNSHLKKGNSFPFFFLFGICMR